MLALLEDLIKYVLTGSKQHVVFYQELATFILGPSRPLGRISWTIELPTADELCKYAQNARFSPNILNPTTINQVARLLDAKRITGIQVCLLVSSFSFFSFFVVVVVVLMFVIFSPYLLLMMMMMLMMMLVVVVVVVVVSINIRNQHPQFSHGKMTKLLLLSRRG